MATLSLKNGEGLFFTRFLLFLFLLLVAGVSAKTAETETTASNSKNFIPDLNSCQCGLFLLNSPSLQTLPSVNSKPVVSGLAVAANCTSKNDRESCASTCLKLVHVMAANDIKSPIVHLVAEVATRTIACQSISTASMKNSRKSMKKKGFNGLKIANNIHNDETVSMETALIIEKKVSGPKWLGGFYRWCDSTWTYAGISVQEPLCCLGPEAKTCPKDGDGSFRSPKVNNSSSNTSEIDPGSSRNGRQSRFQEEDDEEITDAAEDQEEEEEEKEESHDLKSSKKSQLSTETEETQFDGLGDDDENDKDQADIKLTTKTKTKTSSSESKSKTSEKGQPLKNRRSLNSTVLAEAFQFVGVFLRSLGYGNVAEGISQVLPTSKASELLERADVVGDWVWSYQDRYMSYPREFNLGYCYVEYMGFTVATEGLAATTSNIYNRIFKRRASTGSGSGSNKMEHNNQRHNYPHTQHIQQLSQMSMPMPMLPTSYQPSTNPHFNLTKTSFNLIGQMGQHKTFFVPHPVYHFEMNRKARALTSGFDSDSNSTSNLASDSDVIQTKSNNATKAVDSIPIPSPTRIEAENRELTKSNSKSKSSQAQVKKSESRNNSNSNSTKTQGKGQGHSQGQNDGLMDLATAIVQSALGDSGSGSGDNKMSSLVQNALPLVSKVAGNSPMIQSMVQNLVTSFLTPSRTPAPAPSPTKTASGPYQNPYQYQYPSQQQQGQGQFPGQLKNPVPQGNFNTISTNNNNNNNNNQNPNDQLSTSNSVSKKPSRPRPNSNSNSSPTSNSNLNLNSIRKPPTPTSADYDIEDQFTNAHDVSNSVDFSSNGDESSESSRPNGLASIISSLLGDSSSDSDGGNSSLTSLLGKIVQSAIKGYFGSSGSDGDSSSKPSSRRPYGNNKNSLKTGLGSNEGESDIVSMIMDLVRPFFISFFGVVPDQPGYGQLSTSDRRDRQGLGKDSSPYLTNDPDATTGLLDLFFGSPSLPETGSVIYDFGNRMVFAFSRANEPVHGLYCFKQYTANKVWDYFRGGVRNLVK